MPVADLEVERLSMSNGSMSTVPFAMCARMALSDRSDLQGTKSASRPAAAAASGPLRAGWIDMAAVEEGEGSSDGDGDGGVKGGWEETFVG